ncbi:class I SAM-dependent methyltransferase [Methylomonas sp. BW4-1]|uniref:class I SAM-dependent methyltransferase n=1 Tax=Methylomonas sp. BW4-1 TaxID=3376685 RepID=UPI004041DCA4
MKASNKYDQFYASDLAKEQLKINSYGGWPRNRAEAIVAVKGAGTRVLDIGCGNGYLIYQFKDSYAQLIGLEFSAHRLRQAKINLQDLNFLGLQGSAEDMSSIDSGSIDRIVSADTIEHIPDVYATCAEMFRVLRPGGDLIVNTPNIAFIKKRVLLMLGRFPSTSQPNEGVGDDILFDGGHLHYFTYRSLRIILERVGFEMVNKIGYGRFGKIHNIYPSLLSEGVQWVARKPQRI